MELYRLDKASFLPSFLPSESLDICPLTKEHLIQIKERYDNKKIRSFFKQLKKPLRYRGVCVTHNGEVIAYGWVKYKYAKDPFYKIGNVKYFSSFFVDEKYRGMGIYPAMLSYLIQGEENMDDIYISAYDYNVSSLKGLKKVGFKLVEKITFKRIFRITLNKFKLKKT